MCQETQRLQGKFIMQVCSSCSHPLSPCSMVCQIPVDAFLKGSYFLHFKSVKYGRYAFTSRQRTNQVHKKEQLLMFASVNHPKRKYIRVYSYWLLFALKFKLFNNKERLHIHYFSLPYNNTESSRD